MYDYPLVSVYTCVYNGERTLHRVFESMCKLDYPNIEHIIVDDGSTDKTETLIQEYMERVSFPVKCYKKENGGKHTALNVAWDAAEGKFLVPLDADDELLPHSIKYLVDTYYQIPEKIRDQYWCIHGRCVTQNGDFVGERYPDGINTRNWKEAGELARKCSGEKLGMKLRESLKGLRFPEVVGVSHLPEDIIWSQINNKWGTWYTNEVVRVYYVNEGGNLTAKRNLRKQYSPSCYLAKWKLMKPELYGKSFKQIARYSLLYFLSDPQFQTRYGYTQELPREYSIPLKIISPIAYCAALIYRVVNRIE